MQNLNNLLRILLENRIELVLIGGFAGVVHGSTQVTRDLDVCALVTPDEISKLRKALEHLHPKHRMNPNFKPPFDSEPEDLTQVKNLYLETDAGVLDVLSSVTGVGSFEKVRSGSIEIEMYGYKCRVISVEDLIKAKERLDRPKDRLVVAELKALYKK